MTTAAKVGQTCNRFYQKTLLGEENVVDDDDEIKNNDDEMSRI